MQKYAAELKTIEQKLLRLAILDVPGSLMAGLGVYAKFSDDPGSLLPFLANPDTANYLLAFGLASMGLCPWNFM